MEHVDVLIVGAGLSGIGAACHLRQHCPDKRLAILEARSAIGGTWDLFRYPGVRSDSDMYTLGYAFRPWTEERAIASGPTILEYVRETAREHDVMRLVRLRHRVKRAAWSSVDSRWTVDVEVSRDVDSVNPSPHDAPPDPPEAPQMLQLSCKFLFMCSGYYDYAAGYTPDFPGIERFQGRVAHPQHWTPDITYAGQRVVVIGSGATAVTLVPAMAREAAHVTMLQRSPTYVVARPAQDRIALWLRRKLSARSAYAFTRWKNVLMGMYFYRLCKRQPERVKRLLRKGVAAYLGPDYDIDTHFTPRYNPWDQRLCLVPDGDLFRAIRQGRASVVTDRIESFTEHGIRLASGQELAADLVVTATGLNLNVLGDVQLSVDGVAVQPSQTFNYKGLMFSGVPNLASSFGYTNASWTLKCDLTCEYVCRLLNHMDRHGYTLCVPRNDDPSLAQMPWIDFSSGYVQRSLEKFPKQGSQPPWKLHQNYARDLLALRHGKLEDGVMRFARATATPPASTAATR